MTVLPYLLDQVIIRREHVTLRCGTGKKVAYVKQ